MIGWILFTALALIHLAWIIWEFENDRFGRLNALANGLAAKLRIPATMELTWVGHWAMALALAFYGVGQAWLCEVPLGAGFVEWAVGAAVFYTVREVNQARHRGHWDLDSVMDLVGPWLNVVVGLIWLIGG